MDSNQRSANFIVVTAHWAAHSLKFEKEPDEISATGGHRVLSPIDVNDVLYRKVFRGVQGVFTGQECKILPIEWTDEFNPIPVCGQIK